MSDQTKQALCCECGSIRTCRRPRNHKTENYWLTGPIDRNWHRETGDLKCSECGRITRHAIIHPDKDSFRDHAERLTRIALGTTKDPVSRDESLRGRVQAAYRQGREPNPRLMHRWLAGDSEAAREAGRDYVITFCGEKHQIPNSVVPLSTDKPAMPDPVRWDQEYEDPATGLWWVQMDCVDCLRVSNERRMARRRKVLAEWLAWLLAADSRVPDEHVDTLIEAFEATQKSETAPKSQDSTR
ncbi:hypothetical protein QYF68_23285 [Mycolicibacterium austroafricanum]|uniref:HNH endonuclease n=1 Tax=Mycolicibacterium austroafricanum TaxID=39687 RepID=A0ABT8HIX1_MYCAO|nr:hypothetical protein [Mycolicibacterium austroafricanum]MDN4520716.1 hypothetical protein [Mycolicibacterium austroafricanum]